MEHPDSERPINAVERSELGGLLRANAASWRSLLGRGDLTSQRPPTAPGGPPAWSALESGVYVRDTYAWAADRLKRMLGRKTPTFADRDAAPVAHPDRYSEGDTDAAKVSYDLARAAGKVADMVDRVRGDQWTRVGVEPDGGERTVESLVRDLLHQVGDRAAEVERGYEALTADNDNDNDNGAAANGAGA